jgi:O-antigen ligase
LVPVYLLALACALASENRTVWLGLVVAVILAGLLYRPPGADPRVARRWGMRLIAAAVTSLAALLAYNAFLPIDEKLISMSLLELKWETERGAALRAAAGLIAKHPWLGHGFGYVEAYFGTRAIGVVGLGSGVAQRFDSYIDLWVAVGLPGLIYALALVWAIFDRRVLFPTFVVAFLFVSANINPVAQHEYYYLFLGGAYALSRWREGAQVATHPQKEVFP